MSVAAGVPGRRLPRNAARRPRIGRLAYGLADGLALPVRYQAAVPPIAPNSVPRLRSPPGVNLQTYDAGHYTREPGISHPRYPAHRRVRLRAVFSMPMKTYVATPTDRERNWPLVEPRARPSARSPPRSPTPARARKPTYTAYCGRLVVVINAEKISVTGSKRAEKRYYRHSGYPAGSVADTLNDMLQRRPEEVIRLAVRGRRLARKQLTKPGSTPAPPRCPAATTSGY